MPHAQQHLQRLQGSYLSPFPHLMYPVNPGAAIHYLCDLGQVYGLSECCL